jgi:hypothetical protein
MEIENLLFCKGETGVKRYSNNQDELEKGDIKPLED